MSTLHISQDVIIPSAGDFGYVKATSDDGMLLITSHDGLSASWYTADEVVSLTLHDPCTVCGGDFTDPEWSDRHTHIDNLSDVHARCCVECAKQVTS